MSGFSLLSRLCPVLDYTVACFSLLSGLMHSLGQVKSCAGKIKDEIEIINKK